MGSITRQSREKRQRVYDVLAALDGEPITIPALAERADLAPGTTNDHIVRMRAEGIIDWETYRNGRVFFVLEEMYEAVGGSRSRTIVRIERCLCCRLKLDTHPRCAGCEILVGPKHAEKPDDLVDGLCACCWGVSFTFNLFPAEIQAFVQMRRAA